MKKLAITLALFTLSPAAVAAPVGDALDGLGDDRIDLELKEAPVADVLSLLGTIAQVDVVADACVEGSLTLALRAVTVRTVLETVGDALSLTYRRAEDGALTVGCREDERTRPERRLDLELVDAPLGDVLGMLAQVGGTPLTAHGCDDVRVDVAAHNAPVDAVLHQIAAQAEARVESGEHETRVVCRN